MLGLMQRSHNWQRRAERVTSQFVGSALADAISDEPIVAGSETIPSAKADPTRTRRSPAPMPATNFLAFDLGAESGRAVVGTLTDGRLELREKHRFPNPTGRIR